MPARGVPVPFYVILGLLAASAPLRAEPPIKTLAHPARAGKTRPEIIVKYRPEAVVISPILAARKGQSLAQATGKKELASLDRLHQRFGLDLARGRRVFRGAYTGNLPADQKAIRLQASVIQKRFPTRRAPRGSVLPDLSSVFVIPTRAANVLRACQVLTAHPAVVYAEPNYIYHAVSLPDDTYIDPDQDGTWSAGTWGQAFSDLWGMERIQADQAWANGQIGAGVVVAVIDTGADAAHEDLAINMWINTAEVLGQPGVDDDGNGFVDDIHGYDFVNDDGDPLDDHGHGTHASGTVAAAINGVGVAGVAPGATLMAMKGLNASGAGNTTSLANCLIYAVNNGADVLSNSWGGTGTSQLLTDTFQFAHGMGVVSVGAAGNSNANVASFFPANIAEVIAVAAVDSLDQKASFSNFGELLDVAAPGVDILSLRALDTDFFRDRLHFVPPGDLNAKYYRSNGTSMACPAVAGLAALLRSASPGMTNDQVRQVIRDSADDLGDPGFDLSFGYGRINVAAAMANAVDCNANGVDDALDIASGDSPDCNANGRPDECETGGTQDCNTNGVADLCDLFAGTSDDCQANGVPDDCEPLVDCNTNGLFDPCEIRDGLLPDCNANLIPDPCEINGATDCNTNGIPDACEVGFDQDCNSNGTSDLCDLATGAANDCNSNAVPDTCDLAGGLSGDCNTNGRPDECDLADGSSTDCDADGFPDECMATFRAVLSLATLEGSNGFVIAGLPGTGGAGTSVGAAGDVNNDGYADVMVGAPFIGSFTKLHRGDAYVVFGGPLVGVNGLVNLAELQPAEGYVIQGVGTDHELGRSVAGAGDVNADGLDDVVVGAHGANISVSDLPGTGYVVFGSPTAVDDGIIQAGLLFGRQGFQLPGLDAGDHAGYSVSAAGDVNGDRFDDFLIGAYAAVNPNRPGPGFAAGATYVVFGGASVGKAGPLELGLLNGTDGFALHGDFSTDSTGYSVAGAGDVNGDGLDDFVAGAPFAIGDSPIFGPRLGGECYVVFGRQRLG
ncbi:MAG: S8 family serine peptidase, partial [Phycisphaerae bacterium]